MGRGRAMGKGEGGGEMGRGRADEEGEETIRRGERRRVEKVR